MAVAPVKLEGIAANGVNPLDVEVGLSGVADNEWVRGAAHVGMTPFTGDTGANGPQAGEGVLALVAVVPNDGQKVLIAVGRDPGRACR